MSSVTLTARTAAVTSATRTCRRCHVAKPASASGASPTGRDGLDARCRECKRSPAQELAVEHANTLIDNAPDRWPAERLRAELERQRERGAAFDVAWRIGLDVAVDGLTPREQASWVRAFTSTRSAWTAGFHRITWPPNAGPGLFVVGDERVREASHRRAA